MILFRPPVVLFGLYSFIFLLSYVNDDFLSYTTSYIFYMGFALLLFSIFYFFSYKINWQDIVRFNKKTFSFHKIKKYYHMFCIIGILIFITNYFLILGPDWLDFQKFRYELTVNLKKPPIPFHALFNPFFFMSLSILIAYKKSLSNLDKILLLFYFLFFSIISASRSAIIIIIVLSAIFYIKTKNINFSKFLIYFFLLGLLLFLIFEFFALILGKKTDINGMNFTFYLVAPSHALDSIINGIDLEKFSDLFLTFRPIHRLLVFFEWIQKEAQLLPYYIVTISQRPVNVYTMFGVYIVDYGKIGSIIIVSIIGFFSGAVEKLADYFNDNYYLKFLSSLNIVCLILSCFYDYYLSSGFTILSAIFGYFIFSSNQKIYNSLNSNKIDSIATKINL